jgi:protein TonB
MIAGALILIPLLQTEAVPPIALPLPAVSAGAPVRMIKLAATPSAGRAVTRPVRPPVPDPFVAPTSVAEKTAYVVDAIDIASLESLSGGTFSGPAGPSGLPSNIGFLATATPPTIALPPRPPEPPTPPPAPKIDIRQPLRVASALQVSRLIKKVNPEYPALARRARLEGSVITEAIITESGTIDSLHIISGNPIFYQSVLDALQQWRYEPTLLNGQPLEVITTITVNFRLN